MTQADRWATWLAGLRTCGDVASRQRGFERIISWRDRILENAELRAGETLLDVGCGEGLVGFGALERGAGTVVFSDISQDLLDFCKEKARELGVLDRSRFMRAAAENLAQIESESADVVAMRSVLIYVDDKKSAFDEFFRVLRPGGRLSLFEPINRFAQTGDDTWLGYDVTAVGEAARKVRSFYEAIQPPDSDLGSHSTSATSSISYGRPASSRSTCSSSRRSSRPSSAAGTLFAGMPANPRIPAPADALEQVLDSEERARFVAHLRPRVEEGRGVSRTCIAFLTGVKPGVARSA